MKLSAHALNENKLINGGFLAISFAIIFSGSSNSAEGIYLLPIALSAVSIPPLAFNLFILEYKKRFKTDVDFWGYDVMSFLGYSTSFLGLLVALFLLSSYVGTGFISGLFLVLLGIQYLDKLVKSNRNSNNSN